MSHIDLISSSIGTAIAEIITLPICTIKTNYQTHLHYKSVFDVYNNIKMTRGFYGFYDASVYAILSQIVSTATKFTFYNLIKNYRHTKSSDLLNNIANGAIGGGIASVFSHPFDVLKIYRQNGASFVKDFTLFGPSLMYRGWSKSLTKNISITALVFPLYDFANSKVNNPMIAASMTALFPTLIIHPIDYLKVRHISTSISLEQRLYPKFNNARDFVKNYYRGLHINLMRVLPHFVITMTITEYLRNNFTHK